jgi:16S rRNA (guanine(1405)-N(7))-methyltransferase
MEDAIGAESQSKTNVLIKNIVKDIIAKKELQNLDEAFVSPKVKAFLDEHKKTKDKLERVRYSEFQRSKEHEELVKKIRANLREVYGVFIMEDYKKRFELLEELKKNPSLENHNKILALHKSSQERLPYYPIIYKKIFEITGKPERIVDLACGLNPFSYPYIENLDCKPEYLACDLAEKDLKFIERYFKIRAIPGAVKKIDLVNDDINELTKSQGKGIEIVFLLKTLDSLEAVQWNKSAAVLKSIKAKFIVVSFSTKSLGGKKAIKKEKRSWFEGLVKKLKYRLKIFEVPGEMFYVITAR